jgi:hypothetical protein
MLLVGEIMSWFSNSRKVYPTKMFVNYLPEVPETKSISFSKTKSFNTSILSTALGVQGMAISMIANATPKIIDEGFKLVSESINKFAKKDVTKTTVKRNFDILNPIKVSLPSQITIVRGNFATNIEAKGELFGDGEKKSRNQAICIGDKELQIEIDIISAKDNSAIYFQPRSYYYHGLDREGDKITELVLAFAFVPVGKTTLNIENLTFQNFLHFYALNPNELYNFKSESGYDTTYQSSWISVPLEKNVPYTLVVEVQEIREGNSFAKLLQTVYQENQTYLKSEINEKLNTLKEVKDER